MEYQNSLSFAQELDRQDELAPFRDQFYFPTFSDKRCLYFTGNSLGLQPKAARDIIDIELKDWAKWGVEGHFHSTHPWYSYHEMFKPLLANLVGAKPIEVTAMNSLTTNLHLLMISFYRPQGKRVKILCEKKAFPSDQYALEAQVKLHGLDPAEVLVEVEPDVHLIPDEKIIKKIHEIGDELAMIMIGGVNYYTGQLFNIKDITAAAHSVGAYAGWDLAHAAGNVVLQLHNWNVDFAAWCSYKYLNSGPGGVGMAFVHEQHANEQDWPRLAGWWGYPSDTRFKMEPGFVASEGVDGWQLSNAPVFGMAPLKASLDVFEQAGMDRLRAKGDRLTGYLEYIINEVGASQDNVSFEIITPRDVASRGCQLSILTHGSGKELFDKLTAEGVVADWREPNVIRMAPVPLYNSFEDVYLFGQALNKAVIS